MMSYSAINNAKTAVTSSRRKNTAEQPELEIKDLPFSYDGEEEIY